MCLLSLVFLLKSLFFLKIIGGFKASTKCGPYKVIGIAFDTVYFHNENHKLPTALEMFVDF